MKWTEDAEAAVSKIPFFVRRRVRKRVEEEAARCGAPEVTMAHVKTCQRRFLEHMEEEVKGFQVETCFGPGGCPNRAVSHDSLPGKIEESLGRRDLKAFLKKKVNGPLKMHHEFRVSISDCPNACSRPQIADLGLIGARSPKVTGETCNGCGACVQVCREGAISLPGGKPVLDSTKCLSCGQCIAACATGALQEKEIGYRLFVGGKLGRHPRLASEIPGIWPLEEVLAKVEEIVDKYQKHCRRGERLGDIPSIIGVEESSPE